MPQTKSLLPLRSLVFGLPAVALSMLTGCAVNGVSTVATAGAANVQPGQMSGILHGGPNPVTGSQMTLMVSTNNGYGGAASVQAKTTTDSFGNFVFTLPAGFSCPTGQYAYVTSYSGSTGALTANTSSLLMVPVGRCESNYAGNVYTGPTLWVDELTTMVSAYALGNFMTINTAGGAPVVNMSAPANNNSAAPCVNGIGTCTATAAGGLRHAMANALAIINNSNGQPNAANANGGLIPVGEINLVGNILQACVNSTGVTGTETATSNDGTACGKLFSLTTPPTAGSVVPTNTLQAMMNLARYPAPQVNTWSTDCTAAGAGTQTGTACLFGLAPAQGAYANALTSAPPDWALAVVYPKGLGVNTASCTGTCPGLTYPWTVALDITDDVFVSNNDSSSQTVQNLLGFQYDGTPLFTTANDATYHNAKFIATDGRGHVLVPNNTSTTSGVVKVYDAVAGGLQATVATGIATPFGVTSDPQNNIWVSSSTAAGTNLAELVYNTTTSTATVPAYNAATFTTAPQAAQGLYQLSIDSNLNFFSLGNSTTANAYFFPNTGTVTAPAYAGTLKSTATAGSTSNGYGIAPDGNGNAFAVTGTGLYMITKTGTGDAATISAGGTIVDGSTFPRYVEVDGQNNVFSSDYNNGSIGGVIAYDATGVALGVYKGCRITSPAKICGTASSTSTTSPAAIYGPRGSAIDSAGDIWLAGATSSSLTELIGVAAPTWPALSLAKTGRPQ